MNNIYIFTEPKLFNYGIERSDHGGGGGGVKGGETLDSSHSISESLTSTVVQDKPTVHADCSTNTNAHEGKQPLACECFPSVYFIVILSRKGMLSVFSFVCVNYLCMYAF